MPIRLAIVNDFEIIVRGLADMFTESPDIEICELDVDTVPITPVDIALLDTFGRSEPLAFARRLIDEQHVKNVIVYTWSFTDADVAEARRHGINGYVSKSHGRSDLHEAIHEVMQGTVVVKSSPSVQPIVFTPELRWPGDSIGLTGRESEVLALLGEGHSNAEIAEHLGISVNSVKTHVRNVFEKIDVNTRAKAAVWAHENGFRRRNTQHVQPG